MVVHHPLLLLKNPMHRAFIFVNHLGLGAGVRDDGEQTAQGVRVRLSEAHGPVNFCTPHRSRLEQPLVVHVHRVRLDPPEVLTDTGLDEQHAGRFGSAGIFQRLGVRHNFCDLIRFHTDIQQPHAIVHVYRPVKAVLGSIEQAQPSQDGPQHQ